MSWTPLLELDRALTEQAVIQRNQQTADSLGGKPKKNWQPLATVACLHWWGAGTSVTRVGGTQARPEQTVDLQIGGMIVGEGTDITARDRITEILDEAGNVVDDGPYEILAVAPFQGLTEISFRKIS